jgi:hypothetical protein
LEPSDELYEKFLHIGVLTALTVLLAGQSSREEGVKAIESKLLDVASASYKLKASYNGRGYEFCNASDARVVKFRLGCVKKKNGELKILCERKLEDTDLAPSGEKGMSCQFWGSNHGFFPGEACDKGKLAVIEVVLANGVVWKLKP